MAISFQEDLQNVLNRHSAEAPSGTPDYILAAFLNEVLKSFNTAVTVRADHRGEFVDPHMVGFEKLTLKDVNESNIDSDTTEDVSYGDVEGLPEPVSSQSVTEDRGTINLYGKNSVVNIYL